MFWDRLREAASYGDGYERGFLMNGESDSTGEIPAVASVDARSSDSLSKPWVTRLMVLWCVVVFLMLLSEKNLQSWETLKGYGLLPPNAIWSGQIWPLLMSVFVHFTLWHLAFNVYWLWHLGSRLEGAIGSARYLAFVVFAAFVSSAWQLVVSDQTGIGASGVGYALFGYMWVRRDSFPRFQDVLSRTTQQLFILWLVGCVLATRLELFNVGNAAHFSGLMFGIAVASGTASPQRRLLGRVAVGLIITTAVVPFFWCPWSVSWLTVKAFNAHASGQVDEAVMRYSQIIERDPSNAWAYLNRGNLFRATGQTQRADDDFQRGEKIDPAQAAQYRDQGP